MKKTRKKGFTIVELVIVIAVIAILAAVLIPTFTGVINNAKESSAQSEAKNLWTAYCVEKAESFADFNGYVKVLKKGTTNEYYYFTVTNGQLSVDKPLATQAPSDMANSNVAGFTAIFQKTTTGGGSQGDEGNG
mgnify:CR=1 FL=1